FALPAQPSATPLPAKATVPDMSGDLAGTTAIEASTAARGAQVRGAVQVAAFEPRWLEKFQATVENVDPALFDGNLPHAQLAIDITGAGADDNLPQGELKIVNQRPGMLAAGRVPLVSLNAAYRVGEKRVDFSRLHASLGAGG